jgi:predicted nucleic-acid-binding Zn-ribbon protein
MEGAMADTLTCPKCAGTMEPGVVPDMTFLPGSWQGNTERGFLVALKMMRRHWGVKAVETTTYRCIKCGYLESYARG